MHFIWLCMIWVFSYCNIWSIYVVGRFSCRGRQTNSVSLNCQTKKIQRKNLCLQVKYWISGLNKVKVAATDQVKQSSFCSCCDCSRGAPLSSRFVLIQTNKAAVKKKNTKDSLQSICSVWTVVHFIIVEFFFFGTSHLILGVQACFPSRPWGQQLVNIPV